MARVAIGLGSNLGVPHRQIVRALAGLARLPGTRVIAVSPLYRTEPVGGPPQPDYLNGVAIVATSLSPRALLRHLHALEHHAGRRRTPSTPRNAPRTLDLDLLLYERRRLRQRGLALPHPRMHERAFVLRPLADVAPAATIPGHGSARGCLAALAKGRIVRTSRIVPARAFRPRFPP